MIPSTNCAAASVLLTWTLMRSPAGASHTMGGKLSSAGVRPAFPPPEIGDSSWMVSLPEKTVASSVFTGALMMSFSRAGQGRYSYCQPARTFALMAPSGIETEKDFCGMFTPREFRGYLQYRLEPARRSYRVYGARFPHFFFLPPIFLNPPTLCPGFVKRRVFETRRVKPCARRRALRSACGFRGFMCFLHLTSHDAARRKTVLVGAPPWPVGQCATWKRPVWTSCTSWVVTPPFLRLMPPPPESPPPPPLNGAGPISIGGRPPGPANDAANGDAGIIAAVDPVPGAVAAQGGGISAGGVGAGGPGPRSPPTARAIPPNGPGSSGAAS